MGTVRISGNWRNPSKMEFGDTLEVDNDGAIERTLDIPEAVYESIEGAIANNQTEGAIYRDDGVRFQWVLDR